MTSTMTTSSCMNALPAIPTVVVDSPRSDEDQEMLPFVPFMKQRPSTNFLSAVKVEASNTSSEFSDRGSSMSPLSTGSDSLLRPLSSSWSSGSVSPAHLSSSSGVTAKSSPHIRCYEADNKTNINRRSKKRSLFTIDAILGEDKKQSDKDVYSIKRVSQISSERPAKVPRRNAAPTSTQAYSCYQQTTSPHVIQAQSAFLQNYLQQMTALAYHSSRNVVRSTAEFVHGLPTPPLTPMSNPWFPAAVNGVSPVLLPNAIATVPGFPSTTLAHAHNPHSYNSPHPVSRRPEDRPVFSSDGSADGKGKRNRTIFTVEQLQALEEQFEQQHYMVGSERYFLARKLNLNEAQVKVWFQNRRIKWRKQKNQTGVDLASPDAMKQEEQKSHFQLLKEEAVTGSYK